MLLSGPPGAGKSALVSHLAAATGNLAGLLRLHLDDQADAKTLVGAYVCTAVPGEFAWQPGVLAQVRVCVLLGAPATVWLTSCAAWPKSASAWQASLPHSLWQRAWHAVPVRTSFGCRIAWQAAYYSRYRTCQLCRTCSAGVCCTVGNVACASKYICCDPRVATVRSSGERPCAMSCRP